MGCTTGYGFLSKEIEWSNYELHGFVVAEKSHGRGNVIKLEFKLGLSSLVEKLTFGGSLSNTLNAFKL